MQLKLEELTSAYENYRRRGQVNRQHNLQVLLRGIPVVENEIQAHLR